MYEAYFNFTSRPFASTAQVEHYFPGSSIDAARQRLIRCIERGEGPAMVIGPSGTGKTLLCRVLKEHFRGKFAVALLCSGRLSTRKALFQAILYELGRPYRQMDEGELRIAVSDYLLGKGKKSDAELDATPDPPALLLLVDEAQSLSLRLLEEIRMLTNLADGSGARIRLIICGGRILEERFAGPQLESFSQRIAARCYLESFNRMETQQYLRTRVAAVGGDGESMFDAETCRAVYQAADGVPRLINQVCDHALLLAYSGGRKRLRARDIEEAWADMQQLPTPWNEGDDARDGQSGGVGGIVEFGGLDDDDEFAGDECKPSLLVGVDEEGEDAETISLAAVDRLERSLSDLEEDFHPAGTIRPEIELTFGEVDNPFEEEFEEEEVIAQRYKETPSWTAPPTPAAATAPASPRRSERKHQYNQLFAKLRREKGTVAFCAKRPPGL